MAADQSPEVFDGEPGDGQPGFDRGLPQCLREVRLPGAGRAADAEVLPAPDPLQRLERVLDLAGYGGLGLVPVAERLACGEPGSLASGPQVRGITSGGFLGEEDADDLGGVPALAFAVGIRSLNALRRCGSLSRLASSMASASGSPWAPEMVRIGVAISARPCRW